MSDVMLFGVLRMPYDMVMSSELSRVQFYGRAQEAADRIEALEAEVEKLRAKLAAGAAREGGNTKQNSSSKSSINCSAPAAGTDKDAEHALGLLTHWRAKIDAAGLPYAIETMIDAAIEAHTKAREGA